MKVKSWGRFPLRRRPKLIWGGGILVAASLLMVLVLWVRYAMDEMSELKTLVVTSRCRASSPVSP